MTVFAIALLALAPSPMRLDEKVTFSSPGLAVPQLVEELSKAAHVTLFAPKAFQSDIVAIRVKDVVLKDLLNQIGDLTAADWEARGDGFELVRSRVKQKAEEQAELDREIAMFQAGIDKQKKTVAAMDPWTEKTASSLAFALGDAQKAQPSNGRFDNGLWRRMQEMDNKAPGGRAISRVVASLDAKQLASLPLDYKIVFSDQPNGMQRPLPKGVLPALQQMVAEQNIWSDVAGKVIGEPQGGYFSTASWMKRRFEGQVGKVLLMISKNKSVGSLNANIEIAASDRKGAIVVRGNQNLNTSPMVDYKQPTPEPGEKPVPGSPLSEALKGMFDRAPMGAGLDKKLPKELTELLLDPEHHEPLALATGDMLLKVAETKNENLVANMNDESFMMGAFAGAQKMTPSMILKTMSMTGGKVEEKDGWLIVKPAAAATTRAQRLDRSVVGKFVRAVAKEGRASLDEQAAYATASDLELYNTIGYMISMIVTQSSQQNEYFETSMLRLYGFLDPTQRQALERGAKINLGSLTPAQFEIVNKMVFGVNPNLQPKMQAPPMAVSEENWDAFYNGIGREPTEMFPNGIPRNSVVTLQAQSDSVMISPPYEAPGGGMYGTRALGPDEVAQSLYAKERPGIFPWMEGDTGWDQRKFWFGNRRMLNFTFDLGEVAVMTKQLTDTKYAKTDAVPYSQIPAEFRDQVQKRLEEMRKAYANVKPGELGGFRGVSEPPPPPG